MLPNSPAALCVAVHDVAPSTWPECQHLLHAMRAVGDFPITWLVVPRYHGKSDRSPVCEAALERLLGEGHELALHGWTHLDEAGPARRPWQHFLRSVYTQREGEFAAIDSGEARRRMDLGLAWFAERGWPVSGFVAPAWLMGKGARLAVTEFPFTYTTSYTRLHVLGSHASLFSPALVYAARNGTGRWASAHAMDLLAPMLAGRPLVRLALHPRDAHFPALIRHAQQLVERLLQARSACTKAAFVHSLLARPTSPSSLPGTSASVHILRKRRDADSSGSRHPGR